MDRLLYKTLPFAIAILCVLACVRSQSILWSRNLCTSCFNLARASIYSFTLLVFLCSQRHFSFSFDWFMRICLNSCFFIKSQKSLLTKPPFTWILQPKQIEEIKEFLLTARRKDARSVKIKRTGGVTKFKVRCSRYLYTLCVTDADKADKLKQSLPPGKNREKKSCDCLGQTEYVGCTRALWWYLVCLQP